MSQGVCVLAEESNRILNRPLCSLWNEYVHPVALNTDSELKKILCGTALYSVFYWHCNTLPCSTNNLVCPTEVRKALHTLNISGPDLNA